MLDLHVDDDAFVRAPAATVYRRLTDIGSWPDWWPGMRVDAVPTRDDTEVWSLRLRPGGLRSITIEARPGQWRHNAGFRLDLTGDVDGWAEFWLEDGWGGTVVHHLLVASTGSLRPLRVLRDYRTVLRRGMWAFKDDLQARVRADTGLVP